MLTTRNPLTKIKNVRNKISTTRYRMLMEDIATNNIVRN